MQSDLWQRRLGWIGLMAIILFSGVLAQNKIVIAQQPGYQPKPENDRPEPPEIKTEQLQRFLGDGKSVVEMRQLYDDAASSGKYWIGVECREPPPELRTQLGLQNEGLVVLHVAEDGPAAKSGIKQHDVIISAGDTKLSRPSDISKAVNDSDGKEISLKIIRGGKEQTISVTPAERPRGNSRIIARPGPGFMFPGGGPGGPHVDLPDNVTVTIVYHAKDPGKITVTRGDEKWEITDLELNKLPDDLRPLVGQMIGVGPLAGSFPEGQHFPGIRIEGMPPGPPGSNPPPRDGGPPPHDGGGPPRDGDPPHDGNLRDGNPPPRDHGPPHDGNPPGHDGDGPPHDGPRGQPNRPDGRDGFPPDRGGPGADRHGPMMPPEQMLPELMHRLDVLDQRLEMLQNELQRLHEGGPESGPRFRPRGPEMDRNGPPPGGSPPGDGERRGPPPGDPGRPMTPNGQ